MLEAVRQVAVLGAGVMGAQIAAQFADVGIRTLLFDVVSETGDKNLRAQQAIARLGQMKPAPLVSPQAVSRIVPCHYDADLARLRECDLVIEAVAEVFEVKEALYRLIAPFLSPTAVLATNTSGLSIARLAAVCSEAQRPRFCGVHFFNPPRYMRLVELVPCVETDERLLSVFTSFLTERLEKCVVRAKDTPNFIANRVGIFALLAAVANAERFGLRCDVVDDLTGERIGRPRSATFRTLDVIGLDTFSQVTATMYDGLPHDPWREKFIMPCVVDVLIQNGRFGQKNGIGIYHKSASGLCVFDMMSQQYVVADQAADIELQRWCAQPDALSQLLDLRDWDHPQAQFLWSYFCDVFHYVAVHLTEIADNAHSVDQALCWGFGWSQGPFLLWHNAGWEAVAEAIQADITAGKTWCCTPLPDWVFEGAGVYD